jgi:acetyl esterase/lipase
MPQSAAIAQRFACMHDLITLEELATTEPGMALDLVSVHVPADERPLGPPLGLTRGGVQCLRVRTGAHAFAIGVNTRVLGPRLLVTFHGARNDDAAGASMFKRLTWAEPLQTAVLAISDPWTEPTWRTSAPRATMYLGQLDDQPDAEINALIDQVAGELGIPLEGVTLMGVSAGATAAMRVAAARSVGRAILFNPMLDLDGVRRYTEAWLFEHGRSPVEYAELRTAIPWRFDAISAWERGLQAGNDLRALYIQSVNDLRTAKRQLPSACKRLGLDPDHGGPSADGRMLLALHASRRHGVAPLQEIQPLVQALFATPPELVATAQFPVLEPGGWNIPADIVEHAEDLDLRSKRRTGRSLGAQSSLASPGAEADQRLMRPAPPAGGGVLLLSGTPGCPLQHVAWSLGELFLVVARDDAELRRLSRLGEPLKAANLPSPATGQWDVYSVPGLLAQQPDALVDLPQARLLYLLRNPLDAVLSMLRRERKAQQAAEADAAPPDEAQLLAAVDRWNRSVRGLLTALRSQGDRILVLRQPGAAADWEQAVAWLGRQSDPDADPPLEPEGKTLPPWLDERARSLILEHADLASYQRLLQARTAETTAPPSEAEQDAAQP